MKVVLFCGGQGLRMAGVAGGVPKPMVPLGPRPIIWHLMKYYAHWGHTDFILCLGHKGGAIKDYFATDQGWRSNVFTLPESGRQAQRPNRDPNDWRITFVDTGQDACVGERLLAVREHLRGEATFLANYADGLSDYPLPLLIQRVQRGTACGAFLATRPNTSFHFVDYAADGAVLGLRTAEDKDLRINGGYFVFRQEIFDYLRPGEELVEQPFARMIERRNLLAQPYDGFWRCCDTFKDLKMLEGLLLPHGPAPWELWRRFPPGSGPGLQKWSGSARPALTAAIGT